MEANTAVQSGSLANLSAPVTAPPVPRIDPNTGYPLESRLWVLGGSDLEMKVIAGLLRLAGERFVQPRKEWGNHSFDPSDLGIEMVARESSYHGGLDRRKEHLPREGLPRLYVFVECSPGKGWEDTNPVVLDHHGEQSQWPAAVLQVLKKLDLQISEPTRRFIELVAANDVAHIEGMRALGASIEEIGRIRALDREAQGIGIEHEREAERAIGNRVQKDRLTIVSMEHSKTATVTDRLYGSYDQLLVRSGDGEANFFGDGKLCAELQKRFGGWSGGSGLGVPSQTAYWGMSNAGDNVQSFIEEHLMNGAS